MFFLIFLIINNLPFQNILILLKTRDAVEVFAMSFPSTLSRVEGIKFLLVELNSYGVSNKNYHSAANLINNYVLSFVADELRAKDISPEEAAQFRSIFGGEYEISLDFKEQFLYGLRVILAGLLT